MLSFLNILFENYDKKRWYNLNETNERAKYINSKLNSLREKLEMLEDRIQRIEKLLDLPNIAPARRNSLLLEAEDTSAEIQYWRGSASPPSYTKMDVNERSKRIEELNREINLALQRMNVQEEEAFRLASLVRERDNLQSCYEEDFI